ncbi:hypothetical protein HGRIS_005159 [Hohenbuehelia grisea]|uniref:Uncharacterized protein n=1 Tax=Hohenbuehelia grisea TaxID=104357 RepID=A0ABR3JF14_9AGAR
MMPINHTFHDCHIPASRGDGEPALAPQPHGGAGQLMDGFTGNDASSYQSASLPAAINPLILTESQSTPPPRGNCSAAGWFMCDAWQTCSAVVKSGNFSGRGRTLGSFLDFLLDSSTTTLTSTSRSHQHHPTSVVCVSVSI